jgi:hypothetical protein
MTIPQLGENYNPAIQDQIYYLQDNTIWSVNFSGRIKNSFFPIDLTSTRYRIQESALHRRIYPE